MTSKLKCQRSYPCRYSNPKQCAHDTMLGSECPKTCDCPCHSEQVEGQSGEVELAELAVAAALLIAIVLVIWKVYNG